MKKYSNGFIENYKEKIDKGEYIVGQEMYHELEKLISEMDDDRFIYDCTEADRRMDFMQSCIRLTKSPYFGKNMVLFDFQKALISALYGFYMADTGKFRFTRCLLLIGRKNTKSETSSALLLTDMCIGGTGRDIVCSSNDDNQADILYQACDTMRQMIDPKNEDTWKNQKGLRCIPNNNKIFKLSDRVKTKEGRNIDLAVVDECFTGDTEILTENGWVSFEMLSDNTKVAQWEDGIISFVNPIRLIKNHHEGNIIGTYIGKSGNVYTTPNHNLFYYNSYTDKYEFRKASDLPKSHYKIINHGVMGIRGSKLTSLEKLFIATQADGSFHYKQRQNKNTWTNSRVANGDMWHISFKKQRKYDRFVRLAEDAGIDFKELKVTTNGKRHFTYILPKGKNYKIFSEYFSIGDMNYDKANDFIDELIRWDGYETENYRYYSSVVKENVEFASAIAVLAGYVVRISVEHDERKNTFSDVYRLWMRRQEGYKGDRRTLSKKTRFDFSGDVYCVEVPSHKIVIKSDGYVTVCGNCHEMKDNVIVKSIEQSQSVKENPLLILITTDGFINDGFLDKELARARSILWDEIEDAQSIHYLPWLYTMDSISEVWDGNRDNKLWMKANPTLGMVKKWEYLEQQVDLARSSKEDRAFVLTKDFNIHQNSAESWLLEEDYAYDAPFDPSILYNAVAVAGVDLAETTDLCSASVFVMADDHHIYSLSKYWIPETKLQPKFSDADGGARYAIWQKDDMVRVDNHNYVDVRLVADWFYELYQKYHIRIYKCGYDVRFSSDFIQSMDYYGFDTEMVYQRPDVMSLPIKMLEADLRNHYIYGLNDMDKWCIGNASIKFDAKGYGLLVKIDNWASKRIDGAVSKAIAYEMYRRYQQDIRTAMSSWQIQE